MLCIVFLDPDSASDNRDDLANILYSLLFAWLNTHIDFCRDDFDTFISLFDPPGPKNTTNCPAILGLFCINFIQKWIFTSHADEYQTEGASLYPFDPLL